MLLCCLVNAQHIVEPCKAFSFLVWIHCWLSAQLSLEWQEPTSHHSHGLVLLALVKGSLAGVGDPVSRLGRPWVEISLRHILFNSIYD